MPYIRPLTDKNGVSFYPQTVMNAVYDGETGKPLSNGIPAGRYRSFTIDNPLSDATLTGYSYSQTFTWENVLPTDEATVQIVSGYDIDDGVAVETDTDAVKVYFSEDPTGAIVRVRIYPVSIGNLPSETVANLQAQINSVAYTNVPIGAVQGFLRTTAPAGWLACDGGTYSKSLYKDLYDVLVLLPAETRATWGNADWVDSFNVPNLQGEFLRGAGANSHANQGNGASVGVHQDATELFNLAVDANGRLLNRAISLSYASDITADARIGTAQTQQARSAVGETNTVEANYTPLITSRPTSTSVLYCIKYTHIYDGVTDVTGTAAVELDSRVTTLENQCDYSTEEKVVGKWIDGRPVYQKTIIIDSNFTAAFSMPANMDMLIDMQCIRKQTSNTQGGFPYVPSGTSYYDAFLMSGYYNEPDNKWYPQIGSTLSTILSKLYYTFRYTKTTD